MRPFRTVEERVYPLSNHEAWYGMQTGEIGGTNPILARNSERALQSLLGWFGSCSPLIHWFVGGAT